MADRTIEFLLLAKDQASKAFDAAGSAAERSSSKIGGALKTFGTGALLGAGAAAAAGLASIAKDAFAGAQEAAQITRVLNSQIANLGPTGQQAFSAAADFADELSSKIGQDDDDIKAVQTKLASFPDAFRQGSLGADAMRRATAAAFDLQAIGIGSAESNIIGIGKALNDPIKGMTALSKAGVSFSEAQKKAIEQAMKQGDLAKAQSVILQGIESNAKGAAEASTSNIEKVKVSLGNMAEGIAGSLLPGLDQFAGWFNDKLPGIQGFFDDASYKARGFLDMFINGTDNADDWINGMGLTKDSPAIQGVQALHDAAQQLWPTLVDAFTQIKETVGPVLKDIGGVIKNDVAPAFSAFIEAAAPIVSWLVDKLMPTVKTVFGIVAGVIKGALQVISGILNIFAGLLTGDWSRLWNGIKQVFSGVWTAIKAVFTGAIKALSSSMSAAVGALKAIATRIGNGILDALKTIIGKVKGVAKDIVDGLANGIRNAANRVWDAATSIVNKIPQAIRKIMGIASPSRVMAGIGRNIMDGLLVGFDDRRGAVEGYMGGLALEPSAGAYSGGGLRGGPVYNTIINAGAVGSEAFLARTVDDAMRRSRSRGYGYGTP